MEKQMKKSLSRQMTAVFVGLLAFVLAAVFIVNAVFLGHYYTTHKESDLLNTYNALKEAQESDELTDENKQWKLSYELEKMNKVITREYPEARRETLLVLDATTGQNGLNQAREFAAACGVTGIILTKLDGTAKGGVAIAIRDQLGLPIKFVGTGESIGDLTPFSAAEFAQALLLNEDEE